MCCPSSFLLRKPAAVVLEQHAERKASGSKRGPSALRDPEPAQDTCLDHSKTKGVRVRESSSRSAEGKVSGVRP